MLLCLLVRFFLAWSENKAPVMLVKRGWNLTIGHLWKLPMKMALFWRAEGCLPVFLSYNMQKAVPGDTCLEKWLFGIEDDLAESRDGTTLQQKWPFLLSLLPSYYLCYPRMHSSGRQRSSLTETALRARGFFDAFDLLHIVSLIVSIKCD